MIPGGRGRGGCFYQITTKNHKNQTLTNDHIEGINLLFVMEISDVILVVYHNCLKGYSE